MDMPKPSHEAMLFPFAFGVVAGGGWGVCRDPDGKKGIEAAPSERVVHLDAWCVDLSGDADRVRSRPVGTARMGGWADWMRSMR